MRLLLILVLPAAMAAFALPSAASADESAAPTITSDQADYAPGSTVTLTGAGWSANEAVHISVDDNDGQTWHFQDDTTADATGGFVEQVTLPDWFVATYSVQATGASGATASTSFTDSNVQVGAVESPSNTRIVVPVLWTTFRKDSTCTGTTQQSGTVNTVTNGNGFTGTTGVGQQTAMSIQAQQNVVISGHLWTFSGWTGPVSGTNNPLCVPGNADNGKISELASYVDSGTTVQQTQTITFATLPDKTFGDADFTVSATASSGLPVSFSASPSSVCTVTGNLVHLTGVGDCTITASQGGNATYLPATDLPRSFTVNPGGTTVTITCPTSVTYTGSAIAPCTATATSVGGFSQGLTVTYSANVNVGTVTASASFAGDGTHAAGSNSTTFAITQASSTVNITCGSATYDGTAQTPCTATATGAGLGTGVPLTPSYGTNINAGTNTATVSATWAGDTNHTGNSANTTFSIAKATSTTTITCSSPVIYTGSAINACGTTATVTGAGGLSTTVPVTYPGDNTDVATGIEADATYAGDSNHSGSSDTKYFDISQASSVVTITCTDVTYDTTAQEPCTAKATGANLDVEGLTVTYANNTDAGQADASASWPGDANHSGNSSMVHFTIKKADTSITLTCTAGSTYDGTAQTPCSATLNGPGLGGSLSVTYGNNINAGTDTATADASYTGDGNHNGSTAHTTFSIAQATSTVTVDCSGTFTYTGSSQQPCTASVSGAGGLTGSVDVDYPADTTDAGTVNVTATYAGDDNHTGDTGNGSYVINKADTTTTVTCTSPVTYTGNPQTPCSATVTGPNLSQSLTPQYLNNTNATSSASASATYLGDSNHNGSSDTKYFVINQASSTTTVTCTSPQTYTGSAITPCTATATGAGNLSTAVTPVNYTNNVNVGSAGASATYAGDANHLGSTGTGGFTIQKADVTVTVTCPTSVQYNGYAQTPCTASLSGPGLTTQSLTVTYGSNNKNVTTSVSASASWPGDGNHNPGSNSTTFAITKAPLTVAAIASSMTYGDPVPTNLTANITGFLGTDTQANSTTGSPSCTTDATSSSPASGTGSPAAAYSVTCTVGTLQSSNYSFSFTPAVMTVNAKASTLGFTGSLFWSTGSSSATTANVTLQGQITPGSGGSPNLLNAKPITFNLYKSSNLTMTSPDATCTTSNVNASGVFTCNIAALGIDNWTVIIHLGSPGSTFFNAPDSDPVVLTVYQPGTDAFATGGGWVIDPSANVSTTNKHGNFGFTVRYKGSSPQGQAVFVFRGSDGNDYVVKSNSWQGGGLAFGTVSSTVSTVSFSGKCNVTVINRVTGQVVASYGNYTFRVDALDSGSPSTNDTYAISVYSSTGTLYHQAGTTGSQLALQGGNIVVHPK